MKPPPYRPRVGAGAGTEAGAALEEVVRGHEDDDAIVGGHSRGGNGEEKCGKTKSGEATHACLQWAERGFTMHRGD